MPSWMDDETVETATRSVCERRGLFNLDRADDRVQWKSTGHYAIDRDLAIAALLSIAPVIESLVEKEREACAEIALAIDSKRGNEAEIAKAIRSRSSGAGKEKL